MNCSECQGTCNPLVDNLFCNSQGLDIIDLCVSCADFERKNRDPFD